MYENMWEVNVKGFKPRDDNGGSASVDAKDTFTNKTKFQMAGPHRLVVTQDTVKFFRLDGSHESRNFPVRLISGHSEPKSRSDIGLLSCSVLGKSHLGAKRDFEI